MSFAEVLYHNFQSHIEPIPASLLNVPDLLGIGKAKRPICDQPRRSRDTPAITVTIPIGDIS